MAYLCKYDIKALNQLEKFNDPLVNLIMGPMFHEVP